VPGTTERRYTEDSKIEAVRLMSRSVLL